MHVPVVNVFSIEFFSEGIKKKNSKSEKKNYRKKKDE